MTPQRIQRKRTRGWKMPTNTVYVGRPTKWGNPWVIGIAPEPIETLVQWYRDALEGTGMRNDLKITIDDVKRELRGKNLACWCPLDQPCHADVLLELANKDQS